jgi:hypothetical protein
MAVGTVSPPGTSTPTPITIGSLEGAAVAFVGAFFSAFTASAMVYGYSGMSAVVALVTAGGAAATFLGYHAYQSS